MNRFAATIVAAGALLASGSAFAWQAQGSIWAGDLDWRMNSAGSSSAGMSNELGILQDAYEEWESPSCTDFNADYLGTTSASSTNSSDGDTTHGFLQSWPSSYGSPWGVIGITISVFWGGEYIEADVNFNEQVYTFVDGAPGGGYSADLESIAVHEFGHSLGLDHSNFAGSVPASARSPRTTRTRSARCTPAAAGPARGRTTTPSRRTTRPPRRRRSRAARSSTATRRTRTGTS